MRVRSVNIIVGVFVVAAFLALLFLAFRVSDMTSFSHSGYYDVTAAFDNIGGLKVRAPVAVSGVKVGDVTDISLDPNSFRAVVTMRIDKKYNDLPTDSSASIFTQGILGSNYVSLTPGFEQGRLKEGSRIETTHPALVLENLIGQLIYSLRSDHSDQKQTKKAEKKHET